MRRILALIAGLAVGVGARAEITPLAHYNLSGAGGIRDTAAPETWKSGVPGGPELARRGAPRIMSNGPACRRQVYDSSVKFEADDQCYQGPQPLAQGERWVLEAWVYAARANDPGHHTVVANGHGGIGFLLCQKDRSWNLLAGGIGDYPLGEVQPETWTHLALVRNGGRTVAYVNGKSVATPLPAVGGGVPNFSIGATSPGKEPFHGWIAEVRYATFEPGQFDPAADFLMDNEQLKAVNAAEQAARTAPVTAILKTPGIKAVAAFDEQPAAADWLIEPPATPASVQVLPGPRNRSAQIMLANGLVSRTFLVTDGNLGCISLRRSDKDIEFVRALKPEARVRINDGGWTEIGGLTGAPDQAFIAPEWLDGLTARPGAFRLAGMSVGPTVKPYAWQPKCNAPPTPWPAAGRRVTFHFTAPPGAAAPLKDLAVDVLYEIYDGLPVIMKTFTARNGGTAEIVITQFEGEHLAVQPTVSRMLHVESDYSCAAINWTELSSGLGIHAGGGRAAFKDYYMGGGTTRFLRDPEWGSCATLNPAEDLFLDNPENALLLSRPSVGPAWTVAPGESFDAFRTYEILNDTTERERYHLAQRRFYKKLAPQTTEHQFEVHAPHSRDIGTLGPLIDQMAEVGFETLQAPEHPGSFNYADTSDGNIGAMKIICDYARKKGIRVGAYQLVIASQGGWGAGNNCIDPVSKSPGSMFGQSVCAASAWADMYYSNMWVTIERAGMGAFKPDGPYHGDCCAATNHPHHKGLADSQWAQWKWMCKVLAEGQRRNLYLTIPDYYVLNGQACTGMGYREATDNIDIVLQTVIYRQYIFDGTWHKTAGMGWVNLNTEVLHGGMERNLDKYERALFVMLSSGAQVWVRGHRLYDGPQSRAMLKKWLEWYRRYRAVIQGDLIHLKRPDGRGLDYTLHVNPAGREKGLLLVFNPLDQPVSRTLDVPLYYTGLTDKAQIREQEGPSKTYRLDHGFAAKVPVTIQPNGYTWLVVE